MKKQILSITMAMTLIIPVEAQISTYTGKVTAFCKKAYYTAIPVIKDCLLSYAIAMTTTIAHELGHKLAQQACYGYSYDIDIGGYHSPPYLIFYPNINIRGFSPLVGRTGCTRPCGTKDSYLKDMIISAAGPLMGIIASFVGLKLLKKYAPNKYPLSKKMCYLSTLPHIISASPYIPYMKNSDGQHFYESYKKYRENHLQLYLRTLYGI